MRKLIWKHLFLCAIVWLPFQASVAQAQNILEAFGGLAFQAVDQAIDQAVDEKKAEDQYLETIRKKEKKFLSKVCELSPEQNDKLNGLGDDLKLEALKNKRGRAVMGEAFPVQVGNVALALNRSTISEFRRGLREKFKEVLTAEQKAKYQSEIDAKDEFTRQACAECLVAIIDERVALEPDQFKPLADSLKSWDGGVDMQLDYFLQSSTTNYRPQIPDKFYKKLLTPDQLKVFEAASVIHVGGHMMMAEEETE